MFYKLNIQISPVTQLAFSTCLPFTLSAPFRQASLERRVDYTEWLSLEKAIEMCKDAAKSNDKAIRGYMIETEEGKGDVVISEFDSDMVYDRNGNDMLDPEYDK